VISDHHHAPAPWERTARWAYVRGHGPSGRYWGRYPRETLVDWEGRIAAWSEKGDVYVYFDNDPEGAAPIDAGILEGLIDEAAERRGGRRPGVRG
jgi:uncharacterized protein YecE (DUF72 family)